MIVMCHSAVSFQSSPGGQHRDAPRLASTGLRSRQQKPTAGRTGGGAEVGEEVFGSPVVGQDHEKQLQQSAIAHAALFRTRANSVETAVRRPRGCGLFTARAPS